MQPFTVALDDDRHPDVDLVVRAQGTPRVAVDDHDVVDGNQVVADGDARALCGCGWFDLGDDDRSRGRGIRLESGVDGPEEIAVNEQAEVKAERARNDQDPEGRTFDRSAQASCTHASQVRHDHLRSDDEELARRKELGL